MIAGCGPRRTLRTICVQPSTNRLGHVFLRRAQHFIKRQKGDTDRFGWDVAADERRPFPSFKSAAHANSATPGRRDAATQSGNRGQHVTLLLYHPNVLHNVAIVVPDLMFQSRIEAAVRRAGLTPVIAATSPLVASALDARPALVVVDLHAIGIEPERAIRDAKAAGARVLAFGRHTEPVILRAARDAGADRVVPRSQLVEELHELIASLVGA